MSHTPPRQRLASILLGRDVLDFIEEHRTDGRTWPEVRDLLQDATDGEVNVTRQAVQQWMQARDAGAA